MKACFILVRYSVHVELSNYHRLPEMKEDIPIVHDGDHDIRLNTKNMEQYPPGKKAL